MASGCKNTPLFYALCHHKLYNKRPTVKTACKPLHMTCQGKQTQIWLYTFSFLWRFLVVKIYCCFTHNFLIKQAEETDVMALRTWTDSFFLVFYPEIFDYNTLFFSTPFSFSIHYNILSLTLPFLHCNSLTSRLQWQWTNGPTMFSEGESKYCLVAKNIH